MTKRTSVESHFISCHLLYPRLLNVFFPRSLLNYCIRLLSCVTVLSLLEISVIKMGNRSLGYFPYQNSVPGATLLWWLSCSCTLDVLSWVQFRGSFLITGRYFFPLTLWSDLGQICTTHYVNGYKSTANRLECTNLSAGAEISSE